MNTQMNIRLDESLKQKLDELARSSGKSSSEVVRELISDYVKDRDIGQYIDELWDRIGHQLRNEEFDSDDIPSVIDEVRDESL